MQRPWTAPPLTARPAMDVDPHPRSTDCREPRLLREAAAPAGAAAANRSVRAGETRALIGRREACRALVRERVRRIRGFSPSAKGA
jgi:hypothetical protein